MSMESNHQIESKLKAYAAERLRRLGEAPTMPPDTRRSLHLELDRRLQRSSQELNRERRWESFLPHLGWAAATVGVLAISAIAIWQGDRLAPKSAASPRDDRGLVALVPDDDPEVLEMARANQTELAAPADPFPERPDAVIDPSGATPPSSSAMTMPTDAPPTGLVQPRAATSPPSPPDDAAPSFNAETTVASEPAPAGLPETGLTSTAAPRPAPTGGSPVTAAIPASPNARSAPDRADAGGSAIAADAARLEARAPRTEAVLSAEPGTASATTSGLNQRYLQTVLTVPLRRNYNSPPRPDVLNDFRLEQARGKFQIRDRDGSVYPANLVRDAGVSRGGAAAQRSITTPASRQATRGRAVRDDLDTLYVNAIGTNLSLNRRVAFDGHLILTNAQVPALPADGKTDPAALRLWLNNSVMRGSATVGDRTRLNIDAAPAPE